MMICFKQEGAGGVMMKPAKEPRHQPTRATAMASRQMLTACLLLLAARSHGFYLGPSAGQTF